MPEYEPPLDDGIRHYVEVLASHHVHTIESCEGDLGHTYYEPTVVFSVEASEGFRALSVAMRHGFPIDKISKVWTMMDSDPDGPYGEMTFYRKSTETPDDTRKLLSGPV